MAAVGSRYERRTPAARDLEFQVGQGRRELRIELQPQRDHRPGRVAVHRRGRLQGYPRAFDHVDHRVHRRRCAGERCAGVSDVLGADAEHDALSFV